MLIWALQPSVPTTTPRPYKTLNEGCLHANKMNACLSVLRHRSTVNGFMHGSTKSSDTESFIMSYACI